MEAIAIRGMASLDHRGLIDRIYVEDHQTLLLTKYISCGPHGLREVFPLISLLGLLIPGA